MSTTDLKALIEKIVPKGRYAYVTGEWRKLRSVALKVIEEIDALRAENGKMTEALKQIAKPTGYDPNGPSLHEQAKYWRNWKFQCKSRITTAQLALAETESKK